MKKKYKILLLALSGLIPLFYALYTGHLWEDYFITFKFSRNFAEGMGLVYYPGERVHGFTSPLGVLLPAFTYFISGSDDAAIWLFRILFCIPAFVGGAYFMLRTGEIIFKDYIFATYFCVLLYISDSKSVMFSVNGMETGFMLFFLSWLFFIAVSGMERKWIQLGFCWAGLMWTRPDSCVYIAAFAMSSFFFLPLSRKSQVRLFVKAGLLCALLYLPWFIWAWTYYGSPVPHTILAKEAGLFADRTMWTQILSKISQFRYVIVWVFFPAYPGFGMWPVMVLVFAFICAYISAFTWMIPLRSIIRREIRFFSLFFFFAALYFAFMEIPFPWYLPPATLIAIPAIIGFFLEISTKFKIGEKLKIAIFASLVISSFCVLFFETERMKAQQEIIELGNRKEIGLWLKKNSGENDSVFLECLGYIGYYSERKMLDWPGLVSPEVVKVIKKKKTDFAGTILELKPDWVVARNFEALSLSRKSFFATNYLPVMTFDATEKINSRRDLYGANYLYYDSVFYIFKRQKTNRENTKQ